MTRTSGTDANPRARKKGLIVQRVEGETLVYDVERNKAHCLPETLAAVWDGCDGRRTPEAIARRVSGRLGQDVGPEIVLVALHRLRKARLLERGGDALPASPARREWLRQAAALGGLTVLSITAPELAEAATCIAPATCSGTPQGSCGGLPCCGITGVRCCSQGGGRNCSCKTGACGP